MLPWSTTRSDGRSAVAYSDTNPGGKFSKAGFVLTCEGQMSAPQNYDK